MDCLETDFVVLGGGCFWCLEPVFQELNGVLEVVPGYSGGHVPNPTYEQVCTGTSGHAEVVKITFRPDVISLREILEVFFNVHDPTTLNRQGADVGPQYRSVIFYNSAEQKKVAEDVITDFEQKRVWDDPIVTQVEELKDFYKAEDYHHNYYRRNPNAAYCQLVIRPKLQTFRQRFSHKLVNSRHK